MILVFILFSFFIVGEILQPSGGHVQGKGTLSPEWLQILAMITHAASGWIFGGMKWK